MRDVVIVGTAMTDFRKHDETGIELFVQAGFQALEKSKLDPEDIEALFLGNCLGDFGDRQVHMAPFVHSSIGLRTSAPALRFESACATATVAIINAALLVGSGVYDVVLVGGTEKTTNLSTTTATSIFTMATHSQYEALTGITYPGIFAMAAHMYANKYDIELKELKKHMAEVAVKNHEHGSLNFKAYYRKRITTRDVLNGIMVAEPLQMLDCCPFSDGAAAIVMTSVDKAKHLTKKPIYIIGIGQTASGPLYTKHNLTRIKTRELAAKTAYSQAGILPSDIDICELHDCFTIAEILAIEGLGFYDFGRGYTAATNGDTYLNGSKVAINPSGGLKSRGHPVGATGAAQVVEVVEQLRNESGPRQVEGAKIGLVDTMGGNFGTVCNIVLRG